MLRRFILSISLSPDFFLRHCCSILELDVQLSRCIFCVYFHWHAQTHTILFVAQIWWFCYFSIAIHTLHQWVEFVLFFLSDIILLWNRFDIEKNKKTTQIKGNTAMDRRCEPFYYYEQNNAQFLFFESNILFDVSQKCWYSLPFVFTVEF